MVIINQTLHIIFIDGIRLNVGTNILDDASTATITESKAMEPFLKMGHLVKVDADNERDNLEAIKHSTSKETADAVAKSSKVKGASIKKAAEEKARELEKTEAEIKKQIEEAKKQA